MLQSILLLLNICLGFHMMYEKLTCPVAASLHFFMKGYSALDL